MKSVKITSSTFNVITNPTQSSVLPELNLSPRDTTVVKTAQPQQKWPPSSSPSLPALSEPQNQYQASPQQDFVLYDFPSTAPNPLLHSRSTSASQINWDNRSNNPNLTQASRPQNRDLAVQLAVKNNFFQNKQNQGHHRSSLSPAFANQSLYASTAPNAKRPQRPPVPSFYSAGNLPQRGQRNNMELDISIHDLGGEDFTAFQGGADIPAFQSSPATHNFADFEMSSVHSNIGTVSPIDLQNNDIFSAPNSTAFTHLTSPSVYNESPGYVGSTDTSPLMGYDSMDPADWAPLFPQTEQFAPMPSTVPPPTLAEAEQSPAISCEDLPVASPSERRKSGSMSSPSTRMSATAGVSASRRRTKPLPPIEIKDKDDIVAYKRAKNTLAARKSRERKAVRVEELEAKVRALEAQLVSEQEKTKIVQAERDHWKSLVSTGGQ